MARTGEGQSGHPVKEGSGKGGERVAVATLRFDEVIGGINGLAVSCASPIHAITLENTPSLTTAPHSSQVAKSKEGVADSDLIEENLDNKEYIDRIAAELEEERRRFEEIVKNGGVDEDFIDATSDTVSIQAGTPNRVPLRGAIEFTPED